MEINGTGPEWTRQIGEHSASRTPPGKPARRPTGCMLHPVGLYSMLRAWTPDAFAAPRGRQVGFLP